jgi:hypothetical protein
MQVPRRDRISAAVAAVADIAPRRDRISSVDIAGDIGRSVDIAHACPQRCANPRVVGDRAPIYTWFTPDLHLIHTCLVTALRFTPGLHLIYT